jgi:2-polyprenyl-6-methoxyphenol hydroxylase-like FAD-dependent oxidoreductase
VTHAVVIGASIAGLSAAQALSARFSQITVLDRDTLPAHGARKAVPQGNHVHILLGAGLNALTELFPEIEEDLLAAGAIPFDPGADLGFHRFGKVWPQSPSTLKLLTMSRPTLENTLRQRLCATNDRVSIRDGVAVSGLIGDREKVTGVIADGERIEADLVVDASGRGGRSDRWLGELGFPAPQVAEVKVNVGYASQFLRRDKGFLDEGIGMFVLPAAPDEKRAGVLLPVDGDRWLMTLGGWHGDYPRSEAEFRSFADTLPHKVFSRLLDSQEALSPVSFTGFPASRRRYFEKLKNVPTGYLAIGDAVCSFNPIYGQGMTVAANEALVLRETHEPRAYYRAVAKILSTPWQFAAGGDFAYPETTGARPAGIGLLNRYAARIQRAAQTDAVVRETFFSVQHLITTPATLFRPSIMVKALFSRPSS